MVEQTLRTSERKHTELWPATCRWLLATRVWHVAVGLLHHVLTTSYRPPVTHIC